MINADIGKLPDENIAEVLENIPGVQLIDLAVLDPVSLFAVVVKTVWK